MQKNIETPPFVIKRQLIISGQGAERLREFLHALKESNDHFNALAQASWNDAKVIIIFPQNYLKKPDTRLLTDIIEKLEKEKTVFKRLSKLGDMLIDNTTLRSLKQPLKVQVMDLTNLEHYFRPCIEFTQLLKNHID